MSHECVHKRLYDFIQSGVPGSADNDDDGVPDSIEPSVGFSAVLKDSTGWGAANPKYGGKSADNEVFARMCERNVFGNPKEDWAHDGLNKGNIPPPNLTTRTARTISAQYQPESSLTWPNAGAYVP